MMLTTWVEGIATIRCEEERWACIGGESRTWRKERGFYCRPWGENECAFRGGETLILIDGTQFGEWKGRYP